MLSNNKNNNGALSRYLSPLAVWALAFGCAVGWGAFVMPGTTFLPIAGPLGSVLGLFIGAAVMLLIGLSYRFLIGRYPDAGGSYTFVSKVLGVDHSFLCAWMLMLTYAAVVWANSTALSLIVRYLFGDLFCFGFSYQIAGYTVYMGELLLSTALLALTYLICAAGKRLAAVVQIVCAVLLFGGVCVCFIAVTAHRGGFAGIEPLFADKGTAGSQVLTIIVLAPWAFIGFESISHSAAEYRFSPKKTLPVIIAALVAGVLTYVMLTVCAAMAVPDGFENWSEYISALMRLDGEASIPTFYAAHKAMGSAGLVILGISAFCGIATGLIGNFIALSRLMYRMSQDGLLPKRIGRLNRRGVSPTALLCVAAVSFIIQFFGRTAIGWIVDVTTIGATIVYVYVTICAALLGRRENKRGTMVLGIIGAAISLFFVIIYMAPNILSEKAFSSASYMVLIIWSMLGIFVFSMLMRRDKEKRFGTSTVVWIILFLLILVMSVSWVNKTTVETAEYAALSSQVTHSLFAEKADSVSYSQAVSDANRHTTELFNEFSSSTRRNIFIFAGVILCSLVVIFRIYSMINKREKEVEAQKLAAEENSRAKSVFLANMSHDIRTPLNAVTGYTALALKDKSLSGNVRDYLEKIDNSSKHLLSLINDILDMSRIEHGKMELTTAPGDLCEILDEVSSIFSLQMEQKGLAFNVDYSHIQNRYVICDKNRLLRILLNAVSNAYKFTPKGGKIDVVMSQTGKTPSRASYLLTVSDTGIGMSPEFSKHIFDAFERERNSTVSQQQGTGLGMAIAKSLVEAMGGSIAVRSEQNVGTTLIITVAFTVCTAEEAAPHLKSDMPQQPKVSGKRLLLVEDNPINSEIAGEILRSEGYEVDTAENGKIAVEKIAEAPEGHYSVVLMDVMMPVMDGYTAAKKIRAMDGSRGSVPIVALTANTFESDRKKAFDAGMDAHVAKPFDPEQLTQTIAGLIQ